MMRTLGLSLAMGCGQTPSGDDAAPGLDSVGSGGGIDTSEPPGDGSDGSDGSGGDDSGSGDAPANTEDCNGFDDDADGAVDETCACSPGQVQACFAGPPGSILECRATTQQCLAGGGSETGSTWGACDGLCDDSTLTLDDASMFVVWGAEADDRFTLVGPAGFADIDGDGELDFVGPSVAGDGSVDDGGAAYALFGSACMQGHVLDLATLPLTGTADPDGFGGFVIDDAEMGYGHAHALLTDVDGDGHGDVAVTDSANSLAVVRGTPTPQALYESSTPDGVESFRFTDGGGSWGSYYGHASADLDGDGYDDLFMPAANNSPGSCPCAPNGFSVWWGSDGFDAEHPRDQLVSIGIGTVGQSSQSNFSVMGGAGDFDNDGYVDITGGNGAANDGSVIPYSTMAFFGGPDRVLPSSMTAVDGTDGFRLSGGGGRGPQPNHQHGDFDGDGIDDFVSFGYIPYQSGAELHLVWGRNGAFPAALTVDDLVAGQGLLVTTDGGLATSNVMGVGDIDADGHDDLVVATHDEEAGGVTIVWGRLPVGGTLDPTVDPDVTTITGAAGLGLVSQIAVVDADGDGLGDLVLGASHADGPNGVDSGAGLVKYGSCLAAIHNPQLTRGYDGTETLLGTPDRETFAAGRGDDVVEGGGGFDVVYAGHGDDRVVAGDLGFARLDGGLGRDTLVVLGDGLTIDLRTIGRPRVHEFERFELQPGQTFAANPGDLSAMTSGPAHFEIVGDPTATVILDGDWIPAADTDGDGLAELRHGAITVELDGPQLAP